MTPNSNARVIIPDHQVGLSLPRESNKPGAAHTTGPSSSFPIEESRFLTRDWLEMSHSFNKKNESERLKVMTWNMLAQCLVRRDLFPTSDCLKAHQRAGMLVNEILRYKPDVICLQEVDRVEKILPHLNGASYAELYATGPGKRHGCMILYRDSEFEKIEHTMIEFDNLDVRPTGDQRERKGLSRLTKNIGLIAGLRRLDQPDQGYIIATTHLFWHPSFTYERIRQTAMFLREIAQFQKAHDLQNWPCLVAGDFNFTPTDPAYSLLVGDCLTATQVAEIEISRVVHTSIDSSIIPTLATPENQDEANSAGNDPDRMIVNARPAGLGDGLLSDEEFHLLFKAHGFLRSVYDEGQRVSVGEHGNVIGTRMNGMARDRKGFFEPMWTSYTHYWKTTLDYIFILHRPPLQANVCGFLKTHRTSDLGAGLPLKGVCASDHIALVGEIEIIR